MSWQRAPRLYGGFAGTESWLAERDPDAYPTILSGDLNGDDTPRSVNGHAGFLNPVENSYHVVTADGTDGTAILDGMIVSHGYAYRIGAISGNYADIGSGGGVYNGGPSTSTFEDCVFRANAAIGAGVSGGGSGGAIYKVGGGQLTVQGSTFVDNLTGFRTYSYSETRTQGGAIASWGSVAEILESRFFGNSSHLGGATDRREARTTTCGSPRDRPSSTPATTRACRWPR